MRQIIKINLFEPTQRQLDLKIKSGKQYDDITSKQHKSIRNKLFESQKYLCCYCECLIDKNNYHIEHFYEQDDCLIHKVHSIDYLNNMIVSCEGDRNNATQKIVEEETEEVRQERISNTSCGHKKGKSYHNNLEVDYVLLLNPHYPISHLFSYREGYISESQVCNEEEKLKVDYTIKRLALDTPKLNRRRKKVIEDLQNEILDISNQDEILNYLKGILDETKEKLDPYFSTLKENFSYLLI